MEYEYNRKIHSEIGEAPVARFLKEPEVTRPSPASAVLRPLVYLPPLTNRCGIGTSRIGYPAETMARTPDGMTLEE